MNRSLALGSATLLALVLIALPGWIALNSGDAPAPDDRDLRVARSASAGSENGYTRFEAASQAARLPRDGPTWDRFHAFRAGQSWEPEWISELVAQNAAATALLRAGLASPAFAFALPGDARAGNTRVATLFRVQQLIALAGAQARILLRDGNSRDAIELASLGLRAGKRLSEAEDVDLLGLAMARTFQSLSLIDLEHATRSTRLAPDVARRLVLVLESTRLRAEDWQRAWSIEYERLLSDVDALGTASSSAGIWSMPLESPLLLLPHAYRWHPNQTVAVLAELYRGQRRKSALFCADAGLAGDRGADLAQATRLTSAFAPNALGRLVIGQVRARDLDRFQFDRCQLETHASLVEALIAAKAYSDSEGALPARLEDLVPRYLDTLPLDRYVGAPLRYARAAPAVYSIGADLADAGGGASPNPDDPDEPGLSLAF